MAAVAQSFEDPEAAGKARESSGSAHRDCDRFHRGSGPENAGL